MRATTTRARELAALREQAAELLELAIQATGQARHELDTVTDALSRELGCGDHLARRLEVPLVLHFAAAGFAGLLERHLVGQPASLRALCVEQHLREGLQ